METRGREEGRGTVGAGDVETGWGRGQGYGGGGAHRGGGGSCGGGVAVRWVRGYMETVGGRSTVGVGGAGV